MYRIEHLDIETHHEKSFVISREGNGKTWVIVCFATDCMIMTKQGMGCAHPGDVFIKSPDFLEYHFSPEGMEGGFVNDWIHFSGPAQDALSAFRLPENQLLHTRNPAILRPYLIKMMQEQNQLLPFWEEKCANVLEAMLIRLARECHDSRQSSPKLYNAELSALRSEIRSHPEEGWSVSRMAKKLGLSDSRFSVLYKKRFGRSPKDDLIEMRLDKAKILLLSTDLCLEDIARLCGFQNEFYFSRVFKARERISAGAYRKQ